MKLFVLGPTQSGKTCLATGLSQTSYAKTLFRRAFVANPGGDESRDYLKERQKELDGARWPGGTDQKKTLDFNFQWKGKSASFFFNDYKGERSTDPELLQDLSKLKGDDGVVLLVNPGFSFPCVREPEGRIRFATREEVVNPDKPEGFFNAPAFDGSPLAREWLIEQEGIYAQLIDHLKMDRGAQKADKPVVALAVTASDRLRRKGDLRSSRPIFEDFLAKISTRLETAGFQWKRFDVTVTGPLADQSKPKLARGFANTSPRPFLWILRQLWWRSHRTELKRAGICSVVLAVLAGLGIGGYAWFESDEDFKAIVNYWSECNNALSEESFGKRNLEKAADCLTSLKRHRGFYKEKADGLVASLESDLYEKQKDLICRRISDADRRDGEWEDNKGKDSPIDEIDSIFKAFTPVTTNLLTGYEDLKNNWNSVTKPKLGEEHDEYVFREKVEIPLRECQNEHGIDVMDKLYPLADVINGRQPKTERLIGVQTNLAERLDARVANEWCNFAIRDFEAAASTNATREATRAFVARLEDWTPATTNGAAVKAELLAEVTNAVPGWRTCYERTTFNARMDAAVKDGTMEFLAALYPERVATNDFLTAQFINEQWTSRGKSEFDRACKAYLDGIVDEVEKRRGRPELTQTDRKRVAVKARNVGMPFDEAAALQELEKAIAQKADGYDDGKRQECAEWVRNNISPDRKRTGQNSLWDDYETFMRKKREDNPFAESIVRKAVYQQAESWFSDDISHFYTNVFDKPIWNDAKSLPANFRELETKFDAFKKLCRAIAADKNPDRSSWAYHFAKDCIERGKIEDGIFNAFPKTLVVDGISGAISYYDAEKKKNRYPTNYKRTSFATRIEVVQHNSDGSILDPKNTILLPFEKNGNDAKDDGANSCDEKTTRKEFLDSPVRIDAHAFEEVRLIAAVTDWNKWAGATTHRHVPIYIRRFGGTKHPGKTFDSQLDLSFDLNHSDGIDVPKLELTISGHFEDDSIGDFVEKAKKAAEEARSKGN